MGNSEGNFRGPGGSGMIDLSLGKSVGYVIGIIRGSKIYIER